MKLKSLTINGFKSFADKTKIDFQPGITGIVGPNGSGKSNIIEALRWVLGEQSAKSLRGGKMPDVIFAGSAKRAPLNRAEVEIQFDNSDRFLENQPDDLAITRRIYRSGESEFLLNGRKVRLKDIIELFMDTGLGKESFSVISQGRVESIFNSKPEDRRVLIEETAGILKYKKEKEKAQKELKETDDHLNRVVDILTELNRQKEPLQEQASIAKDYLEQKKQYDHYHLNALVLEIQQLRIEKEQLDQKLAENKQILANYKKQAELQDDQTAKLHQQQQDVERQLDDAQAQLVILTQQKERLEGRKSISEQQHKFQKEKQIDLKKRLDASHQDLAQLEQKLPAMQAQVKKLENQKIELENKINEIKNNQKLAPDELESEIQKLRNLIANNIQEQAKLESQLAVKQDDTRKNATSLKNLRIVQTNLTDELTLNQEKLAPQLEKLKAIDAKIHQEEEHSAALQNQKTQLNQKIDAQRQQWYQASEIMQKAQARLEALKSIEENYSGYYQGVREILKHKNMFTGIEGSVAELINTDSKFALAIETTLGAQLQNIVVENEQVAKKCIQFLTKKRLGRATFLPMNIIKKRFSNDQLINQVKNEDGFLGIASDLVNYDSKYHSVIQALLGTTIIAENIDKATVIANKINHRMKIVSLNGDVINPGGSMTGGANRNSQNGLLKKKEETLQLEKQLQTMKVKLEQLEKNGQKDRLQLAEVVENNQKITNALNQMYDTQKQLHHQVDEQQLKIKRLKQELTDCDERIADLNTTESTQAIDQIKQQLSELRNATKEAETQLNEKQKFSENARAMQIETTVHLNELQQDLLTVTEKLTTVKVQYNEVLSQQKQLQRAIKQLSNQLTEIQDQQSENQLQGVELEAKRKDVLQKHAELTKKVDALQQKRQKLHAKVDGAESELKRVNELQQAAYDEQRQQSLQNGKITTKLEQDLDTLTETFAMSFEKAQNQATETNLADVQRHMKLLKRGIDELGTVNLAAIDEFERINERFEFLNAQQTDLNAAKNTLLQSMNEMDSEVKRRFKTTFDQVAQAFAELFPQIFGGGKAYLSLTNPEDLLTSGIEIMAQPPGKKTQRLSLLSGGERSLTAITLLFALLKVRPVPFAILDEAEAALDDANVSRYSQYLKRFDDETQFIVITHRKGTMMQADVLYGVTMQESGVSKMVSVALTDVI